MSTINISELLTSLSGASGDEKAFREAVLEWTGSPDSKRKSRKSKKSEDGPKKARAPTAWNAWQDLVCGKKDSETQEFKDYKEEKGKGNHRMSFAKLCKEEDPEKYKTFEAQFKSSASSAASAATHDSEDEVEAVAELEAKPVKKAAAKAKKASAKSDSSDVEVAPVIEAKPAKKAAPKAKKPAKKAVESDSDSE